MKKQILLIFIIFYTINIYSQDYNLNVQKYTKYDINDFYNYQKKMINGVYLGYGVQMPSFLNSSFGNNSEIGEIKYNYGHTIALRYKYYPLYFQLSIFSTYYESKQLQLVFPNETAIKYRGVEGSIQLAFYTFVPEIKKISANIVPFIGVGFINSQLVFTSEIYKTLSSTTLASPIGKLGIDFYLSRRLNIVIDYNKSLNLKDKNFSQFSISLRYNLNNN